MTEQRFAIDTNVLVYFVERTAGPKWQRAHGLVTAAVGTGRAMLPLQTIGEFMTTAIRKGLARRVAAEHARAFCSGFRIEAPDRADAGIAISEAEAGRLSYWDALLLATAARHGCAYLLTEDLQDGALIMGVRIRNPFEGVDLAPDLRALLDAG